MALIICRLTAKDHQDQLRTPTIVLSTGLSSPFAVPHSKADISGTVTLLVAVRKVILIRLGHPHRFL